MQYVISDVRGCYDALKDLLDNLSFSEQEDVLYLAGNLVGEGGESMPLILDLCMRPNVYPIWGDKDLTAAKFLRLANQAEDDKAMLEGMDGEEKAEFAAWIQDGGMALLQEFRALEEEDRIFVVEFFDEFEPFLIAEANKRVFIMLHGGFTDYVEGKELEEYEAEELACGTVEPDKRYFKGAYLITAGECPDGKVAKTKAGNLFINTNPDGAGRLACLCLETGKVAYSK